MNEELTLRDENRRKRLIKRAGFPTYKTFEGYSWDLLVLDEWGHVPVDKDGFQLLFRVISDSYESKSLILTTNLEFSKWGGIFTSQTIRWLLL